jgi:hypothetical protein
VNVPDTIPRRLAAVVGVVGLASAGAVVAYPEGAAGVALVGVLATLALAVGMTLGKRVSAATKWRAAGVGWALLAPFFAGLAWVTTSVVGTIGLAVLSVLSIPAAVAMFRVGALMHQAETLAEQVGLHGGQA